jgi:PadR family transcriptional regulator PadR
MSVKSSEFIILGKCIGGNNMISPDIIRGFIDIMLLHLLNNKDSYGYELSKSIKEKSGEQYEIKETTLYSALDRLETSGYIKSYVKQSEHFQKRVYYKITDQGKSYFKEKKIEWRLIKNVINKFTEKND